MQTGTRVHQGPTTRPWWSALAVTAVPLSCSPVESSEIRQIETHHLPPSSASPGTLLVLISTAWLAALKCKQGAIPSSDGLINSSCVHREKNFSPVEGFSWLSTGFSTTFHLNPSSPCCPWCGSHWGLELRAVCLQTAALLGDLSPSTTSRASYSYLRTQGEASRPPYEILPRQQTVGLVLAICMWGKPQAGSAAKGKWRLNKGRESLSLQEDWVSPPHLIYATKAEGGCCQTSRTNKL